MGDIRKEGGPTQESLWASGLHKSYPTPDGRLHVLRGVELACLPGETLAIVGASGVGKSTLLHVLGALDVPDEGDVRIAGTDPFALDDDRRAVLRNRKIGFVFQFHHLMPEFTARENVAMPLWVAQMGRQEAMDRAEQLLDALGLGDRSRARPDELSGGERQRVAIARALVTEPAVLLADEPTGNLDGDTARSVYNRMIALTRDRNTALVVATHDMELAAQADRRLRLRDGEVQPAEAGKG